MIWVDTPFADNQGNNVDSSWTLTYSFRGSIAAAGIDAVGVATGSGWTTTVTPAQSAAMNTGGLPLIWYWSAWALKAGVRHTAGDGTLQVKPNLAALTAGSSTYDGRSVAEQTLSAIETEISARATGGMTVEYTIGNRSLKKEPMAALIALRTTYKGIVARERRGQQIANGLGNPTRVGVRFTS